MLFRSIGLCLVFYLETKCKLSTVLRIKLSINKTAHQAAKESVIKNNNFGENIGSVILFIDVVLT